MIINNIKSLHIAPTPFFANRGCHIRIKNEIVALTSKQIQTIICTYHHGDAILGFDIRRIATIPGYHKRDAGYSPFKFVADIFLFFLVLKVVYRERPHIIHGHLHEGALLGWSVKTLFPHLKLRLLMDMQGSLSGELEAYGKFKKWPIVLKCFKMIERIICKMPDHFVCSSENSRALLINEFGVDANRIDVIQDMIQHVFFNRETDTRLKKKVGVGESQVIVIYTGSLLPGKGVDHLLEVMRLLIAKRNDMFFILAGYPENSVRPFIKQYKLARYCYLTGEVSYDDLPAWLSIADIAVDPKIDPSGEASGKIVHYMAAGLPVVCYDLANNRSLLKETGFYAKPGCIDDLASKIANVLVNERLAKEKGERGKQIAADTFSIHHAGNRLESIYNKLSNNAVWRNN